jgi:hypothetical protein
LKTLRISDNAHRELTRLLGEMMAKTGKPQTYRDVIDVLTQRSVILPAKLLERIDAAINGDKQLGYASRAALIEEAVAAFLKSRRS